MKTLINRTECESVKRSLIGLIDIQMYQMYQSISYIYLIFIPFICFGRFSFSAAFSESCFPGLLNEDIGYAVIVFCSSILGSTGDNVDVVVVVVVDVVVVDTTSVSFSS